MLNFIKRTRIVMTCSIIVVSILIYFFIFSPLENELVKSIYENQTAISESKFNAAQMMMKRVVESVDALSSRTMIKNKITEYKSGNVDLDELKEYTLPKYVEGLKVIDDVVYALRIVDNDIIAKYETSDYYKTWEDDLKTIRGDGYRFISDKRFLAAVRSPIKQDQIVLGYDCVLFDLTDSISSLCDRVQTVTLLAAEETDSLKENASIISENNDYMLLVKNNEVIFIKQLDQLYNFVERCNIDEIFSNKNAIVIQIIITWVIIVIGFFIIIYFTLIRYARKSLHNTEKSRDEFKSLAYFDNLTGLHSRSYLQKWQRNLRKEEQKYIVIITDIDYFKSINDQYGHIVGDAVLKAVADIIKTSMRKDDVAVRFGGDEFFNYSQRS